MNAPIPQSILSQDSLEQYRAQLWESAIEIPMELRRILLDKAIEKAKISTFDSERRVARLLRAEHFSEILRIIDHLRSVRIEKNNEIADLVEKGLGSYDGILQEKLSNEYSIGNLNIKSPIFIALSDYLAHKESPFIWVPTASEVSTAGLRDQVATQVAGTLSESDLEILEEPKNITLQDVGGMSLAEILALDSITMRMLLENALNNMEELYEGQILASIEDIWPSFDVDMPINIADQVTAWIGFIKGRLTAADMDHFGEFKIFLAFKQLDHSHQLKIIDAMTLSEPLLEDISPTSDPQQSALF